MASLSLYLIILAFFIMMNTISQREGSRTQGVLDSINSSFKVYPQTATIALEVADQGGGEKDAPGFEKSIESIFQSAFPLAEVVRSEMFDQIEVTLPLDSLFTPEGADIRGQHTALLDRLADLLKYQTPGKIREVEALLSRAALSDAGESDAGESGEGESVRDTLLVVNRAGALARELTARGVHAAHIAIGIERRQPDTMRLLFTTRTNDAPDVEVENAP